jgi:hypothetical protein
MGSGIDTAVFTLGEYNSVIPGAASADARRQVHGTP